MYDFFSEIYCSRVIDFLKT